LLKASAHESNRTLSLATVVLVVPVAFRTLLKAKAKAMTAATAAIIHPTTGMFIIAMPRAFVTPIKPSLALVNNPRFALANFVLKV